MSKGLQVGKTSNGSIGRRVGKLTITGVNRRASRVKANGALRQVIIYDAKCDCGRMTTVSSHKLAKRKHCAMCQNERNAARHADAVARNPSKKARTQSPGYGSTHHELGSCWREMLKRCYRPTDQRYPNYGGRGITVCDRWRNSFLAFVEDMGPRPEGYTLDREDTNGNYEPGNCRWATNLMQQNNRTNNLPYKWDDEELPLQGWADRWGVDIRAILVAMKLRVPFGVIARYQTC